mmetsp:Transcript_20960/g.38982  ORF Transcript_20960/g.38982 Transcript_20960/m.38982 type:complete len:312 (-) Transcript_20960:305-1240(-)
MSAMGVVCGAVIRGGVRAGSVRLPGSGARRVWGGRGMLASQLPAVGCAARGSAGARMLSSESKGGDNFSSMTEDDLKRFLAEGEAKPEEPKATAEEGVAHVPPPVGISEEDLMQFLSNPESEGSPFKTSWKDTPGGRSLHGGDQPSTGTQEKILRSSEDAREEILGLTGLRSIRPGDTYDPLGQLYRSGVTELSIRGPGRGNFVRPQRPQRMVVTGKELHFANVWVLSRFLTPMGRIMPRNKTGLSPRKQKLLTKAVKRARQLSLLPTTHRYSEGPLSQVMGEKERNPLAPPEPEENDRNNNNNRQQKRRF